MDCLFNFFCKLEEEKNGLEHLCYKVSYRSVRNHVLRREKESQPRDNNFTPYLGEKVDVWVAEELVNDGGVVQQAAEAHQHSLLYNKIGKLN